MPDPVPEKPALFGRSPILPTVLTALKVTSALLAPVAVAAVVTLLALGLGLGYLGLASVLVFGLSGGLVLARPSSPPYLTAVSVTASLLSVLLASVLAGLAADLLATGREPRVVYSVLLVTALTSALLSAAGLALTASDLCRRQGEEQRLAEMNISDTTVVTTVTVTVTTPSDNVL
jgi:hypothetical protein